MRHREGIRKSQILQRKNGGCGCADLPEHGEGRGGGEGEAERPIAAFITEPVKYWSFGHFVKKKIFG